MFSNLCTGRTSEAISRLLQLAPDTAVLLTVDSDGKPLTEEEIDSALVQRGDILKVVPGAKVIPLIQSFLSPFSKAAKLLT